MLYLTDSHAHLTGQVYDQVQEIVQRAQVANVRTLINICTDRESLEKGLVLAQQFPFIYNVAATTPHDVEQEGEALFSFVSYQAHQGSLVAIGETGLDYYNAKSCRAVQKKYLKLYLELALKCQLPVVIHCREAFQDLFQILDECYSMEALHAPGVLHCFTGTLAEAQHLIAKGWYLSFSGIVTFKKSEALRQVVKAVPLSHLLIETDTPYLAPQSKRGRQNEPAFVGEVAEVIAEVKQVTVEEVVTASTQNALTLFNLKKPVFLS